MNGQFLVSFQVGLNDKQSCIRLVKVLFIKEFIMFGIYIPLFAKLFGIYRSYQRSVHDDMNLKPAYVVVQYLLFVI